MMSGLGQAGFNVGLDGVVGSFVVNGWLFCCWISHPDDAGFYCCEKTS